MTTLKQLAAFFLRGAVTLLILGTILPAQGISQDTLGIVSKAIPNSSTEILIRWTPVNYSSWRQGIINGYAVKRYTISSGGVPLTPSEYENSQTQYGPFTVAPENDWETLAAQNDMAGIVAGCIYGDSLDILPPGGANMVNIYNKAKETTTRFGWSLFAADQDFQVASMMGLGFVDTVISGNEYAYFIDFDFSPAPGVFIKRGYTSVLAQAPGTTTPPQNLEYQAKDRGALIQWDPDLSVFSSFDIERSDDGGATFVKVNTAPIVYTSNHLDGLFGKAGFLDSLADNSTVYIYRVKGRNPFGQVSNPSDTLHVKGKPPRQLVIWQIDDITETESEVNITWMFPADIESEFSGFEVWRGEQTSGPFSKINSSPIPMSARTFTDSSPMTSNYYIIKTFDNNNYGYSTIPLLGQPVDHTPPKPPTSLQGGCDKNGVVTLKWAPSVSEDVMGYRVYFANVENDKYQQVTSVWLKDTSFLHQINLQTLSEDIWFGVIAIDFHHNQSAMTQPIRIARPDIVPPAPPVIKSYTSTGAGVTFLFELSSSTDVTEYRFERKRTDVPGWTTLTNFPATAPVYEYSDGTGDKKRMYSYRLVAIDDAGLQSSSKIINAKKVDDGLRHVIQNFSGQFVSGEKIVQLSWDYAFDRDVIGFEVYRGVNDSTKRRSYAFVSYPQVKNFNPGFSNTVTLASNTIHADFSDFDVTFKDPQLSTFKFFGATDATANQSIPPVNPGGSGTVTVANPNNMAGQNVNQPFKLYYWVVARFADGATSPIAGAVTIQMN